MNRRALCTVLLFGLLSAVSGAAAGERLLGSFRSEGLAPEDIARDSSDGTYWVTSYLDGMIYHYDSSWNFLNVIPSPYEGMASLTGIAYNSTDDTLFVANPTRVEIAEVTKTGEPTGFFLQLDLDPVVNPRGIPFIRSLAFVPESDFLDPMILVYESVGAKIYGFTVTGTRLFSFVHPDDPDGYPGHGTGVSGGGIMPLVDEWGTLTGVEITGYQDGEYVIRTVHINTRLEADYEGFYVPLAGLSGLAAGFERGYMDDPATGEPIPVYFVAVDTQHEIFAFRTDPLPLYEPFEVTCYDEGDDVVLSWRNADTYDRIVIQRNGADHAVLSGTETEFRDQGLPAGTYRYRLWAEAGQHSSKDYTCTRVIGPGQVLLQLELAGSSAGDFTVGPDGLLWITDPGMLAIYRYDPEAHQFADPLQMPLQAPVDEDFWPSLIAVDSNEAVIYILEIAAMDLYAVSAEMELLGDPVKIVLTGDEEEDLYPSALLFDPQGRNGEGTFLVLEAEHAVVYEIARDGTVLGQFRHPDYEREPPPPDSPFGPVAFGMTFAPSGSDYLDLVGGTLWDRSARRILRVRRSDGTPTGWEVPLDGLALYGTPGATSLLWYGQRLFALNLFQLKGVLYELRPPAYEVPPPSELLCRQEGLQDTVLLSFRNNGPYQRIVVERDGAELAQLSGDAVAFRDTGVPPGEHTYRVRAFFNDQALLARSCTLLAGPGAALSHTVLWPPRGVGTVAPDPEDGTYFLTSKAYDERGTVFHIDRDGTLLGTIPSPYDDPWKIGALAVSPRGGGARRITTVGWVANRTDFEQTYPLLLTHQSETGDILWGPVEFEPPIRPRDPFVVFPASCHWDRAEGFWLLERNAGIMWHIDSEGTFLESFVHPAPPSEQFVFALATAFVPERGVFYFTTDTPGREGVSRLVESTLTGLPTGFELPLYGSGLSSIDGAVMEGKTFRVFGSRSGLPAVVTCKAFDDGPEVHNLTAENSEAGVTLHWEVRGEADAVGIERNGNQIAELAGSARSYVDAEAPVGTALLYVVWARGARGRGPHAVVTLFASGTEVPFVRGNANGTGSLNLADAIYTLGYLFNHGSSPPCLDAADADDDGAIRINDPIYVLNYLFGSGAPPKPPFPEPGFDPTPDDLPCTGP